MKGLSKAPTQRYPDAVAFAHELDKTLSVAEEPAKGGLLARVKDMFKR